MTQPNINAKHILIIDDVIDNLRLLSDMLRGQGYEVRCATNGNLALQALLAMTPDLILLDIQMPNMDGFEVCQRLKQESKTKDIPIIFLTALDSIDSKVKGFEVGGSDYITKPFQMKEVLIRVQNQIALQSAIADIHQLNQKLQVQFTKEQDRNRELERITNLLQEEVCRRQKVERQLVYDSLHDSLTGLPNRSYFMPRIDRALERVKQGQKNDFALLFLDLNDFKTINDTLGHTVGDQLLIEFGKLLYANIREIDTVARLGGDEFVILLEQFNSKEDAIAIVHGLLEKLKKPIYLKDISLSISTSIGIAFGSSEYENSSQILRDADIAMYNAKKQSKTQYEFFDQSMNINFRAKAHSC